MSDLSLDERLQINRNLKRVRFARLDHESDDECGILGDFIEHAEDSVEMLRAGEKDEDWPEHPAVTAWLEAVAALREPHENLLEAAEVTAEEANERFRAILQAVHDDAERARKRHARSLATTQTQDGQRASDGGGDGAA